MTGRELLDKAIKARENSYAPYSNFFVGAALLCEDGSVYTGCNIENSGFSATVCAERTAIFKAISEGKRNFAAIAIAGGKETTVECFPCGVCRQVLSEFCDEELIIYTENGGRVNKHKLKELLPFAFSGLN